MKSFSLYYSNQYIASSLLLLFLLIGTSTGSLIMETSSNPQSQESQSIRNSRRSIEESNLSTTNARSEDIIESAARGNSPSNNGGKPSSHYPQEVSGAPPRRTDREIFLLHIKLIALTLSGFLLVSILLLTYKELISSSPKSIGTLTENKIPSIIRTPTNRLAVTQKSIIEGIAITKEIANISAATTQATITEAITSTTPEAITSTSMKAITSTTSKAIVPTISEVISPIADMIAAAITKDIL